MAGEKFTITLIAKMKGFLDGMKKATKSMKKMGMQNRGIVKNMQQMGRAARNSGKAVQKSSKKSKMGFDKMAASAKNAGKAGGKFFKIFAAGAAVLGGVAVSILAIRGALNQARIAAEMDVQAKAFANLVQSYGASSKQLLIELQEAAKGTLALKDIMTTASRAILLGIQQNKLVDLMKIARAASKAMGTSVAAAFSDISLGIGRQSRLILDNLGIIVRVGVAYDAYAQKVGTTADALTDFEKKQAFQNAVIIAGQDIVDRSATGLIDFQDKMAQASSYMADAMARLRSQVLGFFLTLAQFLEEEGIIKQWKKEVEEIINEDVPKFLGELSGWFTKIQDTLQTIKQKGLLRSFGSGIWGLLTMGTAGTSQEKVSAVAEVLKEEGVQGEKESKKLEKKTVDWGERLKKNLKDAFEVASGRGDPTKSDIFVAEKGVKALDEAFKDVNISAQDLQKQFAQTMPVIKRGFESMGPPTEAQIAILKRLSAAQKEVGDSAFVEGLGLETDAMFKKNAQRDLAKVDRLLKVGKISDPKALLAATDKLLKKVRANVEWLTTGQKKKLKELNIALSKVIPADRLRDGLNQWVDDFNGTTDRMQQMGKALAENLSQAWGNFFFDSITGKITSLEDAFKSMTLSMLRSLSTFLGKKATQEFLGLAFGATGQNTQSGGMLGGPNVPSIGGLAGKAGGYLRGLFGGGNAPISAPGGGPPAPGGGFFSGIGGMLGGIGKLFGFADGGIASFQGAGTGIHGNPTLAAIAEKPGKKEAVMPLEKFTDLVQPININISTIDTKSFQQYMNDNKETVLGTIMGVKGSPLVKGMQSGSRGPF
jgi:hypothetical protein